MIRISRRQIGDALMLLLAAMLLLWLADWAVWRLRVWRGGGYDTVQVTQLLLTPLKNHRVKADEQSTTAQPCARALFPHGGDDPCWWLRRHATQWQEASVTNITVMPKSPFLEIGETWMPHVSASGHGMQLGRPRQCT